MVLGYQRYVSDAEITKTKGALLSVSLMLLLLPLGIGYWRGTQKEKWRLGYLTSTEALAARQYLAKIGYAQKSKVETGHRQSKTGHRQSETERAGARVTSIDRATSEGIAAFIGIGGVATLLIVMLPVFFRGSADSSVHTDQTAAVAPLQGANKLNPPPSDIMAAQNRLIELRFLAGPADGVWGAKSRMALRAFKIANGLAPDDKWDDLASSRLYSNRAVRSPLPLATTRR